MWFGRGRGGKYKMKKVNLSLPQMIIEVRINLPKIMGYSTPSPGIGGIGQNIGELNDYDRHTEIRQWMSFNKLPVERKCCKLTYLFTT